MKIPQEEYQKMIQAMKTHPEYFRSNWVIRQYQKYTANTIPSPFSTVIVSAIKQALLEEKALSVIRIGDGETNLLSYSAYPDTPILNEYVVKKIITMQHDSFKVNTLWNITLESLMMHTLTQADIIGVIGLWHPKLPTLEDFIHAFTTDHRGISGQWRAIDFMLNLAKQERFEHKHLASAHLYFSILKHLDQLLNSTQLVFILSNRDNVVKQLKKKYRHIHFKYIRIGQSRSSPLTETPRFLSQVYETLPLDMTGSLSLLGAGPWAEIYCTWIKQRGGVAIDIGSGFDILDGQLTRPIHKVLGLDKGNHYHIQASHQTQSSD